MQLSFVSIKDHFLFCKALNGQSALPTLLHDYTQIKDTMTAHQAPLKVKAVKCSSNHSNNTTDETLICLVGSFEYAESEALKAKRSMAKNQHLDRSEMIQQLFPVEQR